MKSNARALLLSLMALLLCSAACAADYAENEVLVLIRDSNMARTAMSASARKSSAAKAAALATNIGAVSRGSYPDLTAGSGRSIVLMSSPAKAAEELIAELKDNPDVIGVAKNYKRKALGKAPNDALWDKQWGPKRVKAPEVWEAASTGSGDVYVAVLDTGVIYDHPDLEANISGILPDGTYGYFFHDKGQRTEVKRSGTPSSDVTIEDLREVDYAAWGDVDGHGTHVAGIIGAVGDNEIGVAGVNWRVKILPVGVMTVVVDDDGGDDGDEEDVNGVKFEPAAYDSDTIAALDYIVRLKREHGLNIRVANLSLGGWNDVVNQDTDPYAQSFRLASDAGIIICMAAGNEKQDIDNPDQDHVNKLSYPACFRFENTISVGASNENDGLGQSSGSNFSSSGKWVDIMAPGDNIMSTTPKYSVAGSRNYDARGYDRWSGTSMATPVVAGAAALLCAAYPEKTAAEIKAMLMEGAENVLREGYSKYGLLNVYSAYQHEGGESGGPGGPGGSGGGCRAGLAIFALLAAAPLAARRRKK